MRQMMPEGCWSPPERCWESVRSGTSARPDSGRARLVESGAAALPAADRLGEQTRAHQQRLQFLTQFGP